MATVHRMTSLCTASVIITCLLALSGPVLAVDPTPSESVPPPIPPLVPESELTDGSADHKFLKNAMTFADASCKQEILHLMAVDGGSLSAECLRQVLRGLEAAHINLKPLLEKADSRHKQEKQKAKTRGVMIYVLFFIGVTVSLMAVLCLLYRCSTEEGRKPKKNRSKRN